MTALLRVAEKPSRRTGRCSPNHNAVPRAVSHADRDLRASHADGIAYGAMVGFGESYLPAFVLAVGLGEVTAGLVASVPLLAGGLMQMVSPAAVARLGSHKRWVLLCALVQAATFIPLIWAALAGRIPAWGVLAVATVYWGAGLATGPAWNTWIGTLVAPDRRAPFFAKRTLLSQGAVLAGFVGGGTLLQASGQYQATLPAFAAIFLAAALFRVLSFGMLAVQSEPSPLPRAMHRMSPRQTWRYLRHSDSGRLIRYLVAVQAAVQFSGPYFVPYMFVKLGLSYGQYVVLVAAAFVAKIVSLNAWGRCASRLGTMRLLTLGGIGITPVAGLWLVSDHFAWLLVIQLVAGVVWAAYELAFFLLFFESIPEEKRTSVLTLYNLANTAAWVAGSALGGVLLYALGAERHAYLLLFVLSSAGRAVALLLLRRRPGAMVETAPIGVRTLTVRPMSATVDSPILPSLPEPVSGPGVALVEERGAG